MRISGEVYKGCGIVFHAGKRTISIIMATPTDNHMGHMMLQCLRHFKPGYRTMTHQDVTAINVLISTGETD